jgi:hypothetical protein
MNSIAAYLVYDHINTLQAEAADNRLAAKARSAKGGRPGSGIAASVGRLLEFVRVSAESAPAILPRLGNYPY